MWGISPKQSENQQRSWLKTAQQTRKESKETIISEYTKAPLVWLNWPLTPTCKTIICPLDGKIKSDVYTYINT